jgi:hypothetical protein
MAGFPSGATMMGELKWQRALAAGDTAVRRGIKTGLRSIAIEVKRHAKLRVPVSGGVGRHKSGPDKGKFKSKRKGDHKPGTLRQSIQYEIIGTTSTTLEARIGTNEAYGPFLEYGTDRIAGGAVKALGMGENIQDSQAVHSWPALLERRAKNQQMPWLRPAAFMYRGKAKGIMIAAMNKIRLGKKK